jgi:hypothetical protein
MRPACAPDGVLTGRSYLVGPMAISINETSHVPKGTTLPAGHARWWKQSTRRRALSWAVVAWKRKHASKFHRGLHASPSPGCVVNSTGALSAASSLITSPSSGPPPSPPPPLSDDAVALACEPCEPSSGVAARTASA